MYYIVIVLACTINLHMNNVIKYNNIFLTVLSNKILFYYIIFYIFLFLIFYFFLFIIFFFYLLTLHSFILFVVFLFCFFKLFIFCLVNCLFKNHLFNFEFIAWLFCFVMTNFSLIIANSNNFTTHFHNNKFFFFFCFFIICMILYSFFVVVHFSVIFIYWNQDEDMHFFNWFLFLICFLSYFLIN